MSAFSMCDACCQVEVAATSRSVFQRSPTDRGVCEHDRESSKMRKPWPTGSCCSMDKKKAPKFLTCTVFVEGLG